MQVRDFQGVQTIQELECSGSGLDPTFDLLSMSLFTARDDKTIAFVNFAKKECSAYVGFSACFVMETDSHTTHVKSLILDLNPGQRRRYGCNLTAATKEGKTVTVQWFLNVLGKGECRELLKQLLCFCPGSLSGVLARKLFTAFRSQGLHSPVSDSETVCVLLRHNMCHASRFTVLHLHYVLSLSLAFFTLSNHSPLHYVLSLSLAFFTLSNHSPLFYVLILSLVFFCSYLSIL